MMPRIRQGEFFLDKNGYQWPAQLLLLILIPDKKKKNMRKAGQLLCQMNYELNFDLKQLCGTFRTCYGHWT
jgi:hypothetical protein